jgi:hypothetical protein
MSTLRDPMQVKKLLRDAKQARRSTAQPPQPPQPITPRRYSAEDETFSPLLVANKRIVELETECAALHRTCQSFHSLLLRHEAREDVLKRELIEERRQIHIPTLKPTERSR